MTVTREPEYDQWDRAEIYAEQELRRDTCGRCGQYDGLVDLPDEADRTVDVVWGEYGDRTVQVTMFRCLYCASLDAVERVWHDKHKEDKPGGRGAVKGKHIGGAIPKDGRTWVAHPPR